MPSRAAWKGRRRDSARPAVRVASQRHGKRTQLGSSSWSSRLIVNTTTRTSIGTFQFVAANGDTLTAEFTGQAMATEAPNVTAFVEIAIITGGTGRFAGATGGFRVERLLDVDTLVTIGVLRRHDLHARPLNKSGEQIFGIQRGLSRPILRTLQDGLTKQSGR